MLWIKQRTNNNNNNYNNNNINPNTFIRGSAYFPFQTNIIDSNSLLSFFGELRFGNKKLSSYYFCSNSVKYSLSDNGYYNPRGVKLEYDSTIPHIV